jgi:hypothetical protein
VTVAVADRQGHGFLHGASNSPEAAEAMDEISGWILSRAAGTMS